MMRGIVSMNHCHHTLPGDELHGVTFEKTEHDYRNAVVARIAATRKHRDEVQQQLDAFLKDSQAVRLTDSASLLNWTRQCWNRETPTGAECQLGAPLQTALVMALTINIDELQIEELSFTLSHLRDGHQRTMQLSMSAMDIFRPHKPERAVDTARHLARTFFPQPLSAMAQYNGGYPAIGLDRSFISQAAAQPMPRTLETFEELRSFYQEID